MPITLEQAIQTLTDLLGDGPYFSPDQRRAAVKLAIEALTLIKRNRRYTPRPYNIKLPGEIQE